MKKIKKKKESQRETQKGEIYYIYYEIQKI